ncbi:MAG: tetratricopeptide repeat protein [Planctomycetes bacterium]|nr:tetratricopeptide repeat protein [Planctomycetota bacterium]
MNGSTSNWVFDVDEQDFERLVLQQSYERPVVVDFWAKWCDPCRTLGPVLEKLVREQRGEVLLAKVDVDKSQQLAAAFGIDSIPAVKAIRAGNVVLEFTGLLPEPHLREFLNRILPSEVDRQVRQAFELEQKDPARAEALYRRALEQEDENDAVRVGLARVLLARKKDDEVAALLEPVGSEGPLGEEAQRLKGLLSLRGLSETVSGDEAALRQRLQTEPDNAQVRYELGCALAQKGKHEEALEMLLSAGERDPKLAATKVREAMVQVFYAIGPSHPLSDKYRSRLARLLY